MTDISQLDIATLDADAIGTLIAAGETVVERKEKCPKDGLGPSVAAYANSGGGWLVLGVDNAGDVVGWQPPGRVEIHDWFRNHLRDAIDPLPSFNCRTVEFNGKPLVALRIYPGSAPYVLRASGSIYIREPGGKHPIRSQAQLLDLVHQSDQNETKAEARLTKNQLINELVLANSDIAPSQDQTRLTEWMLIATPLVLPVDFGTRALARTTVGSVTRRWADQLDKITLPPTCGGPARPVASSAFIVDGYSDVSGIALRVVIDARGTIGVKLTERLTRGSLHTGLVADRRLAPLLDLAFGTFTELDATGRGLADLRLRVTATAPGWKPILPLNAANQGYELDAGNARPLQISAETSLPATLESLAACAERMMRAIARLADIPYWEPEPS